jgi:hypothetical protein
MHLPNLAVTGNTVQPGPDMWLMSEEDVSRLFHPVDTFPGRFGAALEGGCQLLHLRAIGPDALMAGHAGREAWNCGVAGFIRVFVAEGAFELRAFLFGEVLPVIEFNGLDGGPAAGKNLH